MGSGKTNNLEIYISLFLLADGCTAIAFGNTVRETSWQVHTSFSENLPTWVYYRDVAGDQHLNLHALNSYSLSLQKMIQHCGRDIDDIDFFALHEPNYKKIRSVVKELGIEEKAVLISRTVGNINAAS